MQVAEMEAGMGLGMELSFPVLSDEDLTQVASVSDDVPDSNFLGTGVLGESGGEG